MFTIQGRICALRRTEVAVILPLPRLWKPPGAPALLAGILNLAGTAVPVVSLRTLFGLGEPPADLYQHILHLRRPAQERPLGLLVDRVIDVATTGAPMPVSGRDTLNGCVMAELPLSGGYVAHLLAADRILLEEEKVRLAEFHDAAMARRAAWDVTA